MTEARVGSWLGAGNREVQEKALRDFEQAVKNWWHGPHRRPTWRKKGQHEGFRNASYIAVHRLNRRWATVQVPGAGHVRFRWTRDPGAPKSYRVTKDAAGRWWVAFPVMPSAIDRVPTGAVVGLDRGVANTIATSDGVLVSCPQPGPREVERRVRLERTVARRQKGSGRRERAKRALATVRAHDASRAKDWAEKATTGLVVDYDRIVLEDLRIPQMTKRGRGKRGLNRSILANRWGLIERRLTDKAVLAGVELIKVNPAYTSQRCAACGHVAKENRKSQAAFLCVSCGHEAHADVGAAINILAAGQAVTARGDLPLGGPVKREPHSVPSAA